ncbi:PQQ-binding-like beta-propeller repeat protein (plasmid) [Cytobacillus solani]|uniref:PQQ-binding-like beta-propeller repeat protein n=1 Tax=Cytobacillus solani TaxID=1637975 RepID=UPI002079CD2D|nr:PQQ-binding-like beta-propeller repeat protein [Cytobacillus solani]USK57809.1 PQQ-binding-like beta-propeller repeat protein [Cytobacillus solani]
MKRKFLGIVSIIILLISTVFLTKSTDAATGSFGQGYQYLSGLYDLQSESPTPYNWTRNSPYYSVETNPRIKWTIDLGALVRGNPTVGADGTIYVPTADGYINSVNNDGSFKWKYHHKGISTDSKMGLSAVIGKDGVLYSGNHAIYPDGTEKWVAKVDSTWYQKTAALDSNGNIYFTSVGGLYSIDKNGNTNWKYR